MAGVLSLDIETSNFSYDIGGWDKTHMFEPTVVCTYDGVAKTVFCNRDVSVNADIKPLHPRELGDHLMEHIEKGGAIVGHNIINFDLPVLRDGLDCHAAGVILRKHKDQIIDTSQHLRKATTNVGTQFFIKLEDVCKHTLGRGKLLSSADAPRLWHDGEYETVVKYCLDDAMLNWELWQHGMNTGIVKSRSRWTGDIIDLGVDWKWEKAEIPIHKKHNS